MKIKTVAVTSNQIELMKKSSPLARQASGMRPTVFTSKKAYTRKDKHKGVSDG